METIGIDLNLLGNWLVFALVAGIVAKLLMPGRDPGGLIMTVLLGFAGAFLGNYAYGLLHEKPLETLHQFNLLGLILAIGGGTALLLAYRLVFGGLRRA